MNKWEAQQYKMNTYTFYNFFFLFILLYSKLVTKCTNLNKLFKSGNSI